MSITEIETLATFIIYAVFNEMDKMRMRDKIKAPKEKA
jgi:hypothetical protein